MEIVHPPRISRPGFCHILEAAHSPAAVVGGACYDLIMDYDLDPAIALAMFQHESSYGTAGAAVNTRNWGNVRPPRNGWLQATGLTDGQNGSWLLFRPRPGEMAGGEWLRSCEIWCILVSELYVKKWGLVTIAAAIERYAPRPDGNNPNAYTAAVVRSVELWAREYPPRPSGPPEFCTRAEYEELRVRVERLEAAGGITTLPALDYGPATTTGAAAYEPPLPARDAGEVER